MIVCLQPSLRSSPVTALIIALALADSCTLVTMNISRGLGELLGYSVVECRLQDLILLELGTLSASLSIYFVVVITIERYIIVTYPLKARSFNTWAHKKILIGGVVIFCTLVQVFSFTWTALFLCSAPPTFIGPSTEWIKSLAGFINALILLLLPMLVVCPLNILTLVKNRKQTIARAELSQNEVEPDSVTPMLIATVSVFILCMFPWVVYILLEIFLRIIDLNVEPDTLLLLHDLFSVPVFSFVLQSSLNFIIYCAAGSRFRKCFADLICGTRVRQLRDRIVTPMTSIELNSSSSGPSVPP